MCNAVMRSRNKYIYFLGRWLIIDLRCLFVRYEGFEYVDLGDLAHGFEII